MKIQQVIAALLVMGIALVAPNSRFSACIAADPKEITDSTEPPPEDLFSISAGPVDDPDIVSSQRIPVVGGEVKLSARVRGTGKHPVEVRFILESTGTEKVSLSAIPKLPSESGKGEQFLDYEATWRPAETGIYDFTVQVDPENMSGDPYTKNNRASVILPVTWRELHVLAWGPQRHCKWITAVNGSLGRLSREEVDYWHRRGTKMLSYLSIREDFFMKGSEAELVDFITKEVDDYAASGCDGLLLDETGSYPSPEGLEFIRRFGTVFDRIREKHPTLRVYNWIAGPMNREELENARRNSHILMGETYEAIHGRNSTFPRFVSERIEKLSTVGGIIALGIGGDCGISFRPQIENNVRLCRKLGADLPGICYYAVGYLDKGKPYEGSLQEFLDDLTLKYFLKPVLIVGENDIWPENAVPVVGETLAIHVRVNNIGGSVARNVVAKVYARSMATDDRVLLAKMVIPKIGNGTQVKQEVQDFSKANMVIEGTKHPSANLDGAGTIRVFFNQAMVEAAWVPKQAGHYRLEVELDPSPQYTVLEGFAIKPIAVSEALHLDQGKPYEGSLQESLDDSTLKPILIVNENDIWPENAVPVVGETLPIHVRVHNIGGSVARNVVAKVYARSMATDDRVLLTNMVIPKIGNGTQVKQEVQDFSKANIVIEGTKHPSANLDGAGTIRVFFNQAMVEAAWAPKQAGHYRLEVELDPSPQYTVLEGFAIKPIAVSEAP